MRPPRLIPLLLALVALALPVGAQIKTNAGADAAAGSAGQVGSSFNSGGVAPIALSGAQVSPLSLSPALAPSLSAPAASLGQGLAPSALSRSVRPAASIEEKSAPKAAAASQTPAEVPATEIAGPPALFLVELQKLGVPEALTARLYQFLSNRHPGEQSLVYHGLGHSREVANLTASIVTGQNIPAEKKILMILSAALHDVDPDREANSPARVSATLVHLDKNDEARALLVDFGRYGFTAAQVKALIMATDFDPDPVKMKQIQENFAKAAAAAFPSEPEWALAWGKKLSFSDQISTYVSSIDMARDRVTGFAHEKRLEAAALGKGPGLTDAQMLAGTFKFLNFLKQNPNFALLTPDQRENFDAVLKYFESRQTPEAWASESSPVPARAPPVNPDLASAQRYIKGIFGGVRAPTERESDSLLGDWLDEKGIPRDSNRAREVRAALLPAKTKAEADVTYKLVAPLRRHSALIIRIAAQRRVSVIHVESVIVNRGLLQYLDSMSESQFEEQIGLALNSAELEAAVSKYPDNAQGELMRGVASAMSTKGGKSVEEVARDGVFLYADFNGGTFLRGYASRDPDIQSHTIAFYVTRKGDQWQIDGYRQNKSGRMSDASYIDALKAWLRAGRIPAADLR